MFNLNMDNSLAHHIDAIYQNYETLDGVSIAIGTYLFAIQIYCDFSGYSDIAIGSSRLFGFRLMRNFAYPYFSRDIAEFWQRWHISLSSWFRDYVYIPLGGGHVAPTRHVINILITFVISGFWHGANWTFVVWGFINGCYYLPLMVLNRHKQNTDIVAEGTWLPRFGELVAMLQTFILVNIAWVFFRADSLGTAFGMLGIIFTSPFGEIWQTEPSLISIFWYYIHPTYFFTLFILGVEWMQRTKTHGLEISHLPTWVRWLIYYVITFLVWGWGEYSHVPFIYFQF